MEGDRWRERQEAGSHKYPEFCHHFLLQSTSCCQQTLAPVRKRQLSPATTNTAFSHHVVSNGWTEKGFRERAVHPIAGSASNSRQASLSRQTAFKKQLPTGLHLAGLYCPTVQKDIASCQCPGPELASTHTRSVACCGSDTLRCVTLKTQV